MSRWKKFVTEVKHGVEPPAEVADQPNRPATPAVETEAPDDTKLPLVGVRAFARELQAANTRQAVEIAEYRGQLERTGALSIAELSLERATLTAETQAQRQQIQEEREQATRELQATIDQLVEQRTQLTERVAILAEDEVLQEIGIYRYRHPLDSAVGYKAQIDELRQQIKNMAKANGGAVTAAKDWTVNGSAAKGRKMIREFSKLMLRAYNAEADTLVRGLKPYKLDAASDRLSKSRSTIAKLGATMNIEISPQYHRARLKELELTADYLARKAEEKEAEREEKARLREERKAQQEMQRQREKLEKERQHYANALAALEASGDSDAAGKLREQLADVDRAIEDVDYRAANIRAGYVYVISNVGAFGESMVKIGMTRRLEPMDRVRELGDASVPFRFDVHALFFSNDAVGIEQAMHEKLADKRVNRVNLRREFFYATPAEVRAHLLELDGSILEYEEVPEAVEFHQSANAAASMIGRAGA